jgi:Ca2+-transporting ATPase
MRVVECDFPSLPAGMPKLEENSPKDAAAEFLVEAIAANTTANLDHTSGDSVTPIGNPTEGALLYWLYENGIDYAIPRADFQVQYQITFSTDRKWMGTLGQSLCTGNAIVHIKGAPEVLLGRCQQVLTPAGVVDIEPLREGIGSTVQDYQSRAMRTLAFAYRDVDGPIAHEEVDSVAAGLTWLGFVAIADPLRSDVPPAIKACRDAGIEVKIITGDSPQTAREIASQIGLISPDSPANALQIGREFEGLNDDEASQSVVGLRVLARARPIDKMRVVRLLQASGDVVAVTGDGTNDAPMLRHANVGLAMGRIGTDAAKEASDIVLLDDSFKSIVSAVMWGRSLYENIQRFILFQLTINVAALGIALLGPFIGVELPLTVTQMLWINLIMDTFAALALATEPPHWDVMNRPPRRAADFIVTPRMARDIFGVAGIFLVVLVSMLLYILQDSAISDYELSVLFTVFVMLQFWNLFNARCLGRDESAIRGIGENKAFLAIACAIFVGQVLLVQFGGALFRTVPLSLTHWLQIVTLTSCVLWAGEMRRWYRRLRRIRPV